MDNMVGFTTHNWSRSREPAGSPAKFNLRHGPPSCGHRILSVTSARVAAPRAFPINGRFRNPGQWSRSSSSRCNRRAPAIFQTLEGFAVAGDRPLDRFRRGYFQCTAKVSSTPSGGSMVRVNATITAWYSDPLPGKSGYQVLPSNGRLEADFLDRLQEALAARDRPRAPRRGRTFHPPPPGIPPIRRQQLSHRRRMPPPAWDPDLRLVRPSTWETR